MSTHTSGPWHLCQHLMDNDKCSCGYRGGIWGSDGEHMVCEMGSTAILGQEGLEAPRYTRDVEIANARLIAAAPDLLEALLMVLEIGLADEDGAGQVEDAIYAAIAKAEGRS